METTFSINTLHPVRFTTDHVTSRDGTTIGYRPIGTGPGLIIMHGGLRASHHYERLASALADVCTVHIPDRRGRGLSGPAGNDYSIVKEHEDLAAMLQRTQARWVFGHSGGGLFALEGAIDLPIAKLALYEPAVSINHSLALDWLPAYEQALTRQDFAQAMTLFIKGLRLNWMSRLPQWVWHPLFSIMLRGKEGSEIKELLLTGAREIRAVQQLESTYPRYHAIKADTLLLGGRKSPAYLLDVLPVLAATIPHAHQRILPSLDHTAPDQDAPETVARELKQFFVG